MQRLPDHLSQEHRTHSCRSHSSVFTTIQNGLFVFLHTVEPLYKGQIFCPYSVSLSTSSILCKVVVFFPEVTQEHHHYWEVEVLGTL